MKLDEKVKALLNSFILSGVVLPAQLIRNLEEAKKSDASIKIPSKKQIYNFKSNDHKKRGPKMDFEKLLIHCVAKSHMPTDLDEPFIIKYQVRCDETDVVDGPEIGVEQFRIAISTRRLLGLTGEQGKQEHFTIQVDSTYKLIWNGFPVLVFGFNDLDNVFHPICISITSNETNRDYEFLFGTIQHGLFLIGRLYFLFFDFFVLCVSNYAVCV